MYRTLKTGPGRTRWGIVAGILALPVLAIGGLIALIVFYVLFQADHDGYEGTDVPCADVLHFGGAELPESAENIGPCTEQGFQELRYVARFRMPRAEVTDWLVSTYDAVPQQGPCGSLEADLCLTEEHPDGHPDAGAGTVTVQVKYKDSETARVSFLASTE